MKCRLAVWCGWAIVAGLLGVARAEDAGNVPCPPSARSLPAQLGIDDGTGDTLPGSTASTTETQPGKSKSADEMSEFAQAVDGSSPMDEVSPSDQAETQTGIAPTGLFVAARDLTSQTVTTGDVDDITSAAAAPNALFSPGMFNAYKACPCFFYARFDALLIQREPRFTRQPLVVDPNTNTTFLSTSNLNFNYNPGLRATIGMRVLDRQLVEFSYFGLFGGTASATAVKPDPNAFLIFPDNLAGNVFVGMDRAQVNYSSNLQSFAVNLPCCCGCCTCGCCDECGGSVVRCRSFIWYGGFRYLNVGERLNIAAQKTVAGQVEQGNYNIRTNNNLIGGQLGAMLRRTWGRFGWEAFGNAGVFGNAAQEKQSVTDFPNFALRPLVSASRGGAAFVGETNLSGLYRVTNVWNVRAGYSALWLGGLALAPDQLNFNFANAAGGSQIHNGRGMFLHGVNVGLEAWW